jgi:hypothetical protein
MKHPIMILFVVVLIATIAWFTSLGYGRTKALANGNDNATSAIYVLITATMAFLGETLLGKLAPVQRLKRKARLFKNRINQEQPKVTKAQQQIIHVENQGFAYEQSSEQLRAGHTIARDHAIGEQPPCSR